MVNLTRSMREIEQEYGAHAFDNIDVVMVSTDPHRDTPEALEKWSSMQRHHPKIRYLTGQTTETQTRLCEVSANYNATSDKTCADPDRHSPLIFMIDQNTPHMATPAFALKQDDITQTLKMTLLKKKAMQSNPHMHHDM